MLLTLDIHQDRIITNSWFSKNMRQIEYLK